MGRAKLDKKWMSRVRLVDETNVGKAAEYELGNITDGNTSVITVPDEAVDLTKVGATNTATAAEIARVADASTRIVTTVGTSLAVTELLHDSKVIVMAETGGDAEATYTLPAATGSGSVLKFVVGVVNTSNYVIQVTGDDTMDGHILSLQDGGDTVVGWETAATSDTITLNGTTSGGVSIGDFVELIDIAADQWVVAGITTSSGTEETPFSAAV